MKEVQILSPRPKQEKENPLTLQAFRSIMLKGFLVTFTSWRPLSAFQYFQSALCRSCLMFYQSLPKTSPGADNLRPKNLRRKPQRQRWEICGQYQHRKADPEEKFQHDRKQFAVAAP